MDIVGRTLLSLVLALAVGLAPVAQADSRTQRLTHEQVLESESPETERYLAQKTYGDSSAELERRLAELDKPKRPYHAVRNGAHHVGSTIMNDLVQASLIMAAAIVAQIVRDRMEKKYILGGYAKPKYDEVKEETFKAATDLLCANSKHQPSTIMGAVAEVASEIGCSGEFLVGFVGGTAVRASAGFAISKYFAFLLSKSPTRMALIQTIGTFATSFIMIAGFTSASHLWTQAVHIIGDKDKEEKAHKLFTRAITHYFTDWSDYIKTEDGQLAQQVFKNMFGILRLNKGLTRGWVYNAWRFGLARGELIVNLTVIMGAITGGSMMGTAAAAALGIAGFGATAFAFAIATAVGLVVSGVVILLPDLGVGTSITEVIQSTRAMFADLSHSTTIQQLEVSTAAFALNRFRTPETIKFRQRYEDRTRLLLTSLRKSRVDGINVAFEKYYELRDKLDQAEANLAMAKEVIKNSKFKDMVAVENGDEYLSWNEARKKICGDVTVDHACNIPVENQLLTIDKAKAVVNEGRKLLTEIATNMIIVYDNDSNFLQKVLDNRDLQPPTDITISMKAESKKLGLISAKLLDYMSSLHKDIAIEYGVDFPSEEILLRVRARARKSIGENYALGFDEDKFVGDMLTSIPAKAGP